MTGLDDPRYVRALAHPLRVRLLAMLEEHEASAVELAPVVGVPLPNVAYHLRTLYRLGMLELTRETRVRGAVQRHFRARERPRVSDRAWVEASPVAKQAALSAAWTQVREYVEGSLAAGGFDSADMHLTRSALRLDSTARLALAEALRDLLRRVADIERGVRERQAHDMDAESLQDVGLVLMMFDALPFSTGGPVRGAGHPHGAVATGSPRRSQG